MASQLKIMRRNLPFFQVCEGFLVRSVTLHLKVFIKEELDIDHNEASNNSTLTLSSAFCCCSCRANFSILSL